MSVITIDHFRRAAADIAAYGDNDVLPFDVDTKFISDCLEDLARGAHELALHLEGKTKKECKAIVRTLTIPSERLLAPAGPSGFRITTKIHPFWNLYLNGLAVAIAELLEPTRSLRAHSYRYASSGPSLFRKEQSWRAFKQATLQDCGPDSSDDIVVLTDVSSFYEHIYHHRLANFIADILPSGSSHPAQFELLLARLAGGRSFGLPVGGQCSRVLAEVLMASVDRRLEVEGIRWRRYVDDFVLVAESKREAYRALSVLANALGDLGLSLSRTKTTFLTVRHYREYVTAQLEAPDDETRQLVEIDLHFDPYSDTPEQDYDDLKAAVDQIDIARLLGRELEKGQADQFVVTQIGRALRLLDHDRAYGIAATLLDGRNLHAFRASWAPIMRGVHNLRGDPDHESIFGLLDSLIDRIPTHSSHLVSVDTNALHYLRTIRFRRTTVRAAFLVRLFREARSATVRRACIDCWRQWRDREMFLDLRNRWTSLGSEEQRMLWLAAPVFGDDGHGFQRQVKDSLSELWRVGIEEAQTVSFGQLYLQWAERASEESATA